MSLRVTTSNIGPDIVVFHLSGSITISADTENLESLLRAFSRDTRKLVFDLAAVDQIDADASLFLVRCFFLARGSGGELRFAAARPSVVRPFMATALDTLLSFDPTVTAACEHLTGGSRPGG